jgi:hypothetical protein
MTKSMIDLTVQVPARRVDQALPKELTVGAATLRLSDGEKIENSFYGPEARRYEARWTKGRVGGRAILEVRPSSKLSSELVLRVDAPDGIVRILWSKQSLKRLGALLGRALRYEVETRFDDRADGFDVRRTTPQLVKARTA